MARSTVCVALVTACLVMGCGNPAEDKPEAQVGEAQHGNTPAAGGTALVFTDASKIEFVGSKVTGSHDGGFRTFDGTFRVVDGDPTKSSVEVEIDTQSLWSDNERLTGHLKSADFFDVETYPTARFTSTSITRDGEGYKVTGNLELHGVTKSITFPATIAMPSPGEAHVKAEFVLKRFDWKIEYKGKADDLIRDEVVVRLDMVAKPGTAAAS